MDEKTTKVGGEMAGDNSPTPGDVLRTVYASLVEKGYDPVYQMVGYLLSGDPAYITSHGGARGLIGRVDRDRLMAELVRTYVDTLAREGGGR